MQSKNTEQVSKDKLVGKDVNFAAHPDKRGLCEIGQTNETELALCRYDDETNRLLQCHQFVHCRDFMLDAMVGVESNKDMGIFGFQYLKTYPRPDAANMSLLLRIHGDGRLKDFEKNLPILKNIEDFMGWGQTVASLVDYPGKEKIVWVLGDPKWQKCALTFSLYTYLMKCLTYPISDSSKWMDEILANRSVESGYMNKDYLNFLFANLDDIIARYKNFSGFNDQPNTAIGIIHSYTGFHSMRNLLWKVGGYNKTWENHVLKNYLNEVKN